jgi:hypothetical protein
MSAEIERAFSSTKRPVTADRNALRDDAIENLQLLKYWYQRGVVKDTDGPSEAMKRRTFGLQEDSVSKATTSSGIS